MGCIKSFVYLDEYKMYSISSQLFEGLTEYVLSGKKSEYAKSEEQKGKILSGNLMGEILVKEQSSTEKTYLHDYAYNLFENKLSEMGVLYTVPQNVTLNDLRDKSFVKISGKIIFNDYSKMASTLEQFNEIGEAIGYFKYREENESVAELAKLPKKIADRNSKAKATSLLKSLNVKYAEQLKADGLILDDDVVNRLLNVLKFSYDEQFEVTMPFANKEIIFSSILNRIYLREKEDILISKYSRKTEFEFTVLGIVTQAGNENIEMFDEEEVVDGFRSAIQNTIDKMAGVETFFTGRQSSECRIEPIAIYREL